MYAIYKKRNCGDDCLIAIIKDSPVEYIKHLRKIDRKFKDYISDYSEYYATSGSTTIEEFDDPDIEIYRASSKELDSILRIIPKKANPIKWITQL